MTEVGFPTGGLSSSKKNSDTCLFDASAGQRDIVDTFISKSGPKAEGDEDITIRTTVVFVRRSSSLAFIVHTLQGTYTYTYTLTSTSS